MVLSIHGSDYHNLMYLAKTHRYVIRELHARSLLHTRLLLLPKRGRREIRKDWGREGREHPIEAILSAISSIDDFFSTYVFGGSFSTGASRIGDLLLAVQSC